MLQPFATSDPFTIGVELEVQVVNTHDYNLTKAATELLNRVRQQHFAGAIKPETTEGMIELATGVCRNFDQAKNELQVLRDTLVRAADFLNVGVCGGGTNIFQNWYDQRSDGRERSEYLMGLYGALYQQFTIFGQHVHVGCSDADSALILLHSLSRYVPHFIALAASSPYVQGSDTQFQCARLNSVAPFPLSGQAPFVTTWSEFEQYFDRMADTGLVNSLKDFYWIYAQARDMARLKYVSWTHRYAWNGPPQSPLIFKRLHVICWLKSLCASVSGTMKYTGRTGSWPAASGSMEHA